MTLIRSIALASMAIFVLAPPAWSAPCLSTTDCVAPLLLSTGKTIPFHRSYPLVENEAIERVVIVVHGSQRDADRYYGNLVAAAREEDRLQDTLLMAPNFRTLDDAPAANEHYWSSGGWKIGHKSLDDPGRMSSFDVMNELVERACSTTTFPRLRSVAIIGHSAGGQFVNRYAAGGAGCSNPSVEMRYIVMNPSSYLYPTELRRSASGAFEVPDSCPAYDEYKYGMQDLNSYMSRTGAEAIRSNLFERRTFYLAGEEDTAISSSLDTSCSGNAQGPNRRQRHQNYEHYSRLFEDWTGSTFSTVPGVGHSGGDMLMSEAVRRVTFPAAEEWLPIPPLLPPRLIEVVRQ